MVSVWSGNVSYKDSEGNIKTKFVTAEDANKDINPEEVAAAIDKVKSAVDTGLKDIMKAVSNVGIEGGDALTVLDGDLGKLIEQMADEIGGKGGQVAAIANQVGDALADIYTAAVAAHDELQNRYNDAAKSSQ